MWLTSWAVTKDNRAVGNAGHKMSKNNPRKICGGKKRNFRKN